MSKNVAKAFREEIKKPPMDFRQTVAHSVRRPTCPSEGLVAEIVQEMIHDDLDNDAIAGQLADIISFAQLLRLIAINESTADKKAK